MTVADLSTLDQFAATPFVPGYPADHRTFNAPVDNVVGAIEAVIESASTSQTLAMYAWTHPVLIDAFVAKVVAGVDSLAVIDSSIFNLEEQRLLTSVLACRKRPNFRFSVGPAEDGKDIMHRKVYVADALLCVTGSLNWTESATREDNQTTIGLWADDAELLTASIETTYAYQIAHHPQPAI